MAYQMTTEGMDELLQTLQKAGDAAQGVAAASLYEGAGVVADAVSQAVQGIATSPFKYAHAGEQRLPSPEEKAILTGAARGVSKFRKNGLTVQTSVGVALNGYGTITWNHARSSTRTKYKVSASGKARMAGGDRSGTSSKPPRPCWASASASGAPHNRSWCPAVAGPAPW